MKRVAQLLFICLLPLTLNAQSLTIGPYRVKPSANGTLNLNINPTTGLLEQTNYANVTSVFKIDTNNLKAWPVIKQLFRPYNWVPAQADVPGLTNRLGGIEYNIGVLQSDKANLISLQTLEQHVQRNDTAIANRATKVELQALVTPTGDSAKTAYPRSTVDYLLGQKVSLVKQLSDLALKVDVNRSKKVVTPEAFGGRAQANFDNTAAVNAALAHLKANGGGTLYYPKGRWVQGSINLNYTDNITITTDPESSSIIRTRQRGPAFYGAVNNVTIENLTIDSDSSQIEGQIRLAGSNNVVQKNHLLKGDATSILISSAIFNGGGATMTTDRNVVQFNTVEGQKRYHDNEIIGTSPICVGDYATNTLIHANYVKNCAGDAIDSDNSPGTIISYNVVENTGAILPYTGIWAEGEQTDSDHRVWVFANTVKGYRVGHGVGERARMVIVGGSSINCHKAFLGLNNQFRAYVTNLEGVDCGATLNTLTEGIFGSYGPATLTNCSTRGSAAGVNSICNYSATPFYDRLIVEGGEYDRSVRVAYSTGGLQTVELSRLKLLPGANLIYTDGQNHTLYTDGIIFDDGGIIGSRIKKAIHRHARFTSTDAGRTHINLQTDNFNTYVENSEFTGGSQVTNYATLGGGIRPYGVANVPNTPENRTVQGDSPSTRTRYVTSLDGNAPSGFYNVQGTWQGFPSAIGHWLVTRVHHENSAATGGASSWMTDTAVDMNTGIVYTATKLDDGRGWLPPHRLIMIPANGLQNGTIPIFDSATSQFKFLQPGANGQFLKIVSGVPTYSN